uniref:NADH dehydrogenase subunit 2 n=1 Tax=Eisenia fetida TaxID=6396 RepID=UPI002114825A|nr:NADH dehydrogenase subunit 2 [Eisenia fetida]UTB53940.1 NADH dehydrogenase subunit 2 [Eisenia fetida]
MSLIYSPTMMLTSMSLILSTLMALSSTSWILLWGAMELNLLSFIPILLQTKTHQEVEGSVKYFLAQALGSALLLFSSTSMWMSFSLTPNYLPLLLSAAILLKLGSVPCHFWYPSVMTSISWTSCLILSTWQKLAPLMILTFLLPQKNNQFILMVAGINALIGGMMGMNQSRLRVIMAYSSIGHIGWMLSLLAVHKPNASIMYFLIYSALITPLFMSMNYFNISTIKHLNTSGSLNSSSYTMLMILLLSLGGLPPLTGFMPKFMTIMILTEYTSIMALTLIIGSLMNLFFYLSIVINMMLQSSNLKVLLPAKSLSSNMLLITATFSLGLSPLILL